MGENQRAPYRNAIRSKELIRNAFLQLMHQADIDKIKAKDVIELADVSKGTFYAHYNNIYDIYEDIESEYLSLMFIIFEKQAKPITLEDLLPLFLSGLKEIENQRDTFLLLFRCNYSERFLAKVKNRFLECMLENCVQDSRFQNKDRMRGFFTFVAGGALTLICEWIDTSCDISSDACARFLNACIINGISSVKTNK